ncbi:hypothetical protein QUA84_06105 [Microcoleus sp. F8-C3]
MIFDFRSSPPIDRVAGTTFESLGQSTWARSSEEMPLPSSL